MIMTTLNFDAKIKNFAAMCKTSKLLQIVCVWIYENGGMHIKDSKLSWKCHFEEKVKF